MNWYIEVLKNYATFTGRARRKEYWMFVLVNCLVVAGLVIIESVIRGANSGTAILANLYLLAVLLPTLAVAVRRLHDTNRSGWWLLVSFIPLVGAIVLLIFLVSDSQPGDNTYGPNPKSGPRA
ncbi:MAG: DUF805 domain-containing protein [Proteobacteria bacterium]|nr:DUF805 domain-containing protein [Pseudomonadota bacterium]